MTRRILLAAGATLALAMLGSASPALAGGKLSCSGGYAPKFEITGAVEHPATYTMAELEALPSTRLSVSFVAGTTLDIDTYQGVLLSDLLNAAGVMVNPAVKNDILSKYVVVIGSDCYQTVLAIGDVLPDFGGQPVAVAFADASGPLTSDGMARLVVPADKKGGRYVSNIVRIEVRGVRPQ
jgi:DMSO/TMAO reductase YedYZ molybdopterin-dependent catalytic subunit